MAIPDYQTVMLPLLSWLGDGEEHKIGEAVTAIADQFNLTENERKELLPSGRTAVIRSRVGWARSYMKQAELLEPVKRGVVRITERGRSVLDEKPKRIDVKYLRRFPEFMEFEGRSKAAPKAAPPEENADTPEEALDAAYTRLREDLEAELLAQVKAASAEFFERLVVELLVQMGYGGSRRDAGEALGHSGDGGIDGIIKEDRLGLDIIYLQAKRWDNTVGRPEIQKFAGALQGFKARKGVFISTASFSKGAREYASSIDSKIVLIDGSMLARLMVDHDVGVSTIGAYEVKKLDIDYFADD